MGSLRNSKKVKPLILRHPEQVLARPVGLMKRFQSEQFPALLRVEEPQGIGCDHIAHVARSKSRTQAVAVRGERVTTVPPIVNS